MLHEYMKLVPQNIQVTFTDIHSSPTLGESVSVYLERPRSKALIGKNMYCLSAI